MEMCYVWVTEDSFECAHTLLGRNDHLGSQRRSTYDSKETGDRFKRTDYGMTKKYTW
jgi:hypothetical protein